MGTSSAELDPGCSNLALDVLGCGRQRHTVLISFHGANSPSGPGPPHYRGFTIAFRHTTLSKTPQGE